MSVPDDLPVTLTVPQLHQWFFPDKALPTVYRWVQQGFPVEPIYAGRCPHIPTARLLRELGIEPNGGGSDAG